MKFSFRQILASTAGAVIAAIIASTFGVKGTIIGVAIGSAAATIGTALVAQSIERGHEAVKQVVVKAPDTAMLLRRLGGTGAAGDTRGSTSSAPTQVMSGTSPTDDGAAGTADTVEMASTAAPVGETERLEISAVADAPATERLRATTRPVPLAARPGVGVARPAGSRRFSWQAIAVSAVIVFVLALLLITAIELISGKPLSAIFGGSGTGTSVSNLITPTTTPSTTTPTTTPTASTTTTSTAGSSTTTTTGSSTTTSSTAPTGESTTTTSPAPSQTTTTVGSGVGATTSTTTAP